MNKQEKAVVEFDYTNFLISSNSKKWSFVEAFSSIAPIFGMAWKSSIQELVTAEDRLWEGALTSLSIHQSDERNIIMLTKLAEKEGIAHLMVLMPYRLDAKQVSFIFEKTSLSVDILENDALSIAL